MKNLLREHSYNIVKMFLTQFAIAIFGFVLAVASGKAQNPALRNVTSIFAILFYLFLLYTMTWEIGFHDKISVEKGTKPYRPLTGAVLSVFANIINYLMAIFILLATLLPEGAISKIGGICASAATVLEGMYTGILANRIGGVPLNSMPWVWFVITLPATFTCAIAYLMGLKDKKFTSIFNPIPPESDSDPKQKKFFK